MNGVPTFGEYIRQRRTAANLTRPQLAWLANLSAPYLTKIEGGANPSRRVIESLGTALQLQPVEYEYCLTLAEGPFPRAEPDHPTANDLEYLELLNPKIAAYMSGTMNILAVNTAHAEAFPQLDPGRNYLEWLLLNPVARTVLVDWQGEAQQAVGMFRMLLARQGPDEQTEQIIENCTASPEFEPLWRNDFVASDRRDRTKLVRDPKTLAITELRVNFWRTSSTLQSWMLMVGAGVDQPLAVTRPVMREKPRASRAINTGETAKRPDGRPNMNASLREPTPTQPFQQISGKQ
ncbi:helix-turn-helix domain-containing protein [Nocardia sp. SYP-A9097]|uniref:MmyB family transcriptional regulator n=1 Tax=Nocardia sp. SYP-A9097 TaxID=2663237 RepID=UPI00129C0922|nr:helix-turn-helix domain-containing protein [Nocardia sp. SYP-A9097]MRH87110.1 helix-turn-helix domain-containing protein [Nocardia sp. SYP-A9097]